MNERTKKILEILLVLLVISNIFLAYKFVQVRKTLVQTIENQKVNNSVLSFTQLFMNKVLLGTSEVSFEDRLLLENSVRDLNDKDIYSSWKAFTNAKPGDVQTDFYNLFQLLLKKISA